MQANARHPVLRLVALSFAVLAVLSAAIYFSPSARAFADGVLRQIGGYMFVQGSQPINLRGDSGHILIDKSPGSVSIETIGNVPSANTPAEAGQMAEFTVLSPAYLPEGFTAMSGWIVTSKDNGKVVTKGYKGSVNHFLIINQWKNDRGATQTYARDQIVDVSVRGHAGVWLPDTVNGPAGKNALVWAEGNLTYWLITDSVPLEELLKVAESLK